MWRNTLTTRSAKPTGPNDVRLLVHCRIDLVCAARGGLWSGASRGTPDSARQCISLEAQKKGGTQ